MSGKKIAKYAVIIVSFLALTKCVDEMRAADRQEIIVKATHPEMKLMGSICTVNVRMHRKNKAIYRVITSKYIGRGGAELILYRGKQLDIFAFKSMSYVQEKAAYWSKQVDCPVGPVFPRKVENWIDED